MKFYPARAWGTFGDPLTALRDAGLSAEQADFCIKLSMVNASEVIMADHSCPKQDMTMGHPMV